MLQIRLLGQFDVRADGKRVVIPSRAGQSLFAYLSLSAGTAHRRERLAGLLWPDTSDDHARRNLRQELWRVRKTIGSQQASNGDYIQAEEFTVTFNPAADYWLDVAQLDRLVAADDALNELINQLGLYQGELLPGFYDDWIVLERERVQALFENKMKQLMGALCREQRWSTVLEWSERWIALGQTPEPAYRALMAAYAALGDRSKIVVTFERCEAALDKDLGVAPSDETRMLRDRLLEDEGEALKAETLELIRLASPNLHPSNFIPHPLRQEEPPAPGEPPFKGLQFFDESDAALFFGRELLTAQLVGHLRESKFLAVIVGASGSGKSSIVRAGLIPALKRGEPLADDTLPPAGSSQWPVYIITPTAHPLAALALALTREVESVTAATLQDDLARDPRSLLLYLKRVIHGSEAQHSLLVVDQFEELFTLCRDEFEREAFIDNLLTAILPSPADGRGAAGEGLITLILTIRADFYARIAQYPELREAVAKQQEYIGPMTADELRRAIEEPAKRGGWEFEPGLVDLMLRDVGDEPGALPLLSHALLETWKRRSGRTLTQKGYADAGGVRGAIAYTAETVYQELSPEQHSIARNLFIRLTELGESTEDTRRRTTITELTTRPEQVDEVRAVLNILADARLVTTGEDSAEVAHEALIREWPRLRNWLNEDREGLLLHRHLTEAAHEWDLLDHDPGALYRGARLAQADEWAANNTNALNRQERAFLDASQELEQREAVEREAQRQRELEAAQRLAEEQQQRADEQSQNAKRLRRRAIFLAGAFILAIIMASAALFFGEQARQKAIDVQAANRIATSRELAAASIANLGDDPERSILLALQAEAQADTFQAQDALHQAVQASRILKRIPVAAGDCDCSIAFSPDGTRLVTERVDAEGRPTIQVRDAATLDVLFTKPGVWADDRWLQSDRLPIFAPGSDSSSSILTVWDGTGQIVISSITLAIPFDWFAPFVDLSPDLTTLAASGPDGYVSLYDVATGQKSQFLGKTVSPIMRVQFSPGGRSLLTLSNITGEAALWDVATGRELLTLPVQGNPWQFDFSPDGQRFAFNEDQVVRIVDVASGQDVMKLVGHTGFVEGGMQFNADGTRLATEARDGTARIWDVATGQSLLTLFGHDVTTAVAFSPDGTRLATISADSVQTWGLAPTDSREVLAVPAAVACDCMIAFNPDGTQLAVFGGDQTVKVVDVPSGQTRLTLPDAGNQGWGLAFSPDGARLATAGGDHLARVWDLITGQELLVLKWHTDRVDRVLFSPDGSRLATIGHDHKAVLWDAASGQMLFYMHAYDDSINEGNDVGIAFSPDGSRLATAGGSSIKIWDALTGKEMLVLPRVKDLFAYTAAFSPDGNHLAVGYRFGSASVWDAATGQKLFDLPGHTGSVQHLAYSPDGTRIATTSVDGTTRLWDAATGVEQLMLTGHADQVPGLAFSPDGALLATGSNDGTVRVYTLRVDDLVKIAQSRVTRSLTTAECQKYLHVVQCPAQP